MLQRVRATSDQGPILDFILGDTNQGYIVQDIQGLDPVDAEITSTPLALTDDEVFEHSRFAKRDIILKLGLDARYSSGSVRALRKSLYTIFRPKSNVTLTFYDTEEEPLSIKGTVESFVAPLFTDDPTASIAITCFKSTFYTDEVKTLSGLSVSGIDDSNYIDINYPGDVSAGVVFTVEANRVVDGFDIRQETPAGKTAEFSAQYPMAINTAIDVYTEVGSKGAYYRSNNIEDNILKFIWPGSTWIQLFPGVNRIMVVHSGGTAGIPWHMTYQVKYGGL